MKKLMVVLAAVAVAASVQAASVSWTCTYVQAGNESDTVSGVAYFLTTDMLAYSDAQALAGKGADAITAAVQLDGASVSVSAKGAFTPAKAPEKTFAAVEKAFSRLGETDYALGRLTVDDPDRLFAPMGVLNDLRRDLVAALDAAREHARQEKLDRALADEAGGPQGPGEAVRRLKIRPGQTVPSGTWDEVVVAVNAIFLYPTTEELYTLIDYSILGYSVGLLLMYWAAFDYRRNDMLKSLSMTIFENPEVSPEVQYKLEEQK